MDSQHAGLENLLELWEKLGVRERKVFLTMGYRLWAGQRLHGELSVGKKDWTYEALEEAIDASVYLAAALNDRAEKAMDAMLPDAEKELAAKYPLPGEIQGDHVRNMPHPVSVQYDYDLDDPEY